MGLPQPAGRQPCWHRVFARSALRGVPWPAPWPACRPACVLTRAHAPAAEDVRAQDAEREGADGVRGAAHLPQQRDAVLQQGGRHQPRRQAVRPFPQGSGFSPERVRPQARPGVGRVGCLCGLQLQAQQLCPCASGTAASRQASRIFLSTSCLLAELQLHALTASPQLLVLHAHLLRVCGDPFGPSACLRRLCAACWRTAPRCAT